MVAFSGSYWGVVAGFAISSLGFGFSRPGFTAGASLSVNLGEQARAAGAIAMVNGANGLLAPPFVWLYRQVSWAPSVLTAAILLAMLAYAFLNTRLKNADPRPTTDAAAALATIERRDEGDPF
jgi:hypothetical protein